ncbi:hypothetical protein [Methylobacterium persicinum]|uniref:Uncharacterized protein n=1 Tax=Methylobacterium persicinum TaxID=374426 RepID=A0ABU0HPV3_9HYPH|nr:hypothetical protein [Methylobacterium persicinum]MDQ0444352.1 hypothetical protein [Methylobacterium persicinum]GJE36217.1 hypothetical protein KHHGKMAE_0264 [Methylobacterium persicinum]
MIRILVAASLTLGAGSAFAQTGPAHGKSAVSDTRNVGSSVRSETDYGFARPAYRRDVETTGTIAVPSYKAQKVMGLPVPGSY